MCSWPRGRGQAESCTNQGPCIERLRIVVECRRVRLSEGQGARVVEPAAVRCDEDALESSRRSIETQHLVGSGSRWKNALAVEIEPATADVEIQLAVLLAARPKKQRGWRIHSAAAGGYEDAHERPGI